jgi:hypothetical protein
MNTDVKLLRNVVVGHPGRVGNHLLRTQKSGAVGSKDITFEVGAQIVGPLSRHGFGGRQEKRMKVVLRKSHL